MTKSKAPAKSYEEITRQEIPSFEFFEQGPAPAKVSDLDLIRAVRAGARGFILKDIEPLELRAELAKIGLAVSIAGLHRVFKRHGMTRKKRPATPSNRIARTS